MFLLLLDLCQKIRCIIEYSIYDVKIFTVNYDSNYLLFDYVFTIIESMSENYLIITVFIVHFEDDVR